MGEQRIRVEGPFAGLVKMVLGTVLTLLIGIGGWILQTTVERLKDVEDLAQSNQSRIVTLEAQLAERRATQEYVNAEIARRLESIERKIDRLRRSAVKDED